MNDARLTVTRQTRSGYAIQAIDDRGGIAYLARSRRALTRARRHAFLFSSVDVAEQFLDSVSGFGNHPLKGQKGIADIVFLEIAVEVRTVVLPEPTYRPRKVRFAIFRQESGAGVQYRFDPNDQTDPKHPWRKSCTITAPAGTVLARPAPKAQYRLVIPGQQKHLLAVEAYLSAMDRASGLELLP
jgi:hypothetical protein